MLMRMDRQRGFTVLELVVVIAIILILSAILAPKMAQIIDTQKLASNAQAYSGLLQQARARAVQDNHPYQVLVSTTGGYPMAYVDIGGNQTYVTSDPGVQLDSPITVIDSGAPSGFGTVTLLNVIPLNLETTPPMVDSTGADSPGLAFNERGLPCQRTTAGAACSNATNIHVNGNSLTPTLVAWVTYLRFTNRNGTYSWAAVTVTPAGRIKTWKYMNTTATSGSWQ
jgi:prepilin-type N-terminal cleavage/methylation domain-containing protein